MAGRDADDGSRVSHFGANVTAPIALFVYNRPTHTRETAEALRANHLAVDSDLFIYSDAPKNESASESVQEVREYVKTIAGFKSVTIVERENNWGVDPSIIDGVSELCERFGRVIVLEDDLVTSPWFLTYMNRGLDNYRDEARVMQISGFMFPIEGFDPAAACFLTYSTCWGWGTWQRAWTQLDREAKGHAQLSTDKRKRWAFDVNGAYDYFDLLDRYVQRKTDAWDIRWYLTVFQRDGVALFPHKSLVNNIGFDGSGVHCEASDLIINELAKAEITTYPPVIKSTAVWRAVEKYLYGMKTRSFKSTVKRLLRVGR